MNMSNAPTVSFEEQERIRRGLKKLHWLEQRFGDNARIQGYHQSEVLGQIISQVILLRLRFKHEQALLPLDPTNKEPPTKR